MKPLCRHCHLKNVNRPLGLCWHCYYAPGVRDLYPSTSKFSRRGVGNGLEKTLPPSAPTEAAPGSAEKVAVLCERAAAREDLWHPADAPIGGEHAPLGLATHGERRSDTVFRVVRNCIARKLIRRRLA